MIANEEKTIRISDRTQTVTDSGQTTAWLYDADGNLTDDGVNTYLWDAEQRLIRIKRKGDGQTSNIAYDGLGRRTSITETKQGDTAPNKTTRYVYCGSPTPCAANGTTGLTILEPQGEYNASSTPTQQYYAKDHQGSVMQMVDGQGNTLGTRQYTVYGQTMQASGVAPTLGYAGMLYHTPSGLYLTPYRAYNPANGRWLSRDPIGEDGGFNVYAYTAGNPISYVDPYGLRDVDVYIWRAEGSSVGHVMITEASSTQVILSQFPGNGYPLGANQTKSFADTMAAEGRAASEVWEINVPNDTAFDAAAARERGLKLWSWNPSNDSTQCSIAASRALRAGGVGLNTITSGTLMPGLFGNGLQAAPGIGVRLQ